MAYSRLMKRRAAMLGLSGTLLLPAFISRALAQSQEGARREFAEALYRARSTRRPLLVMVIPANNEQAHARARALGIFLNHGPEDALAALGLVELVCMRVAELAPTIPNVGSAEPLLLLIDPSAAIATVAAFDAPLPAQAPAPSTQGDPDAEEREAEAREQAHLDALIATVATQVRAALQTRLEPLTPPQRAAALTRARETYVQHRIPGSYWINVGGCGVHIEEAPVSPGETMVSFDCGMGQVPARAGRFLDFFVQRGAR